MVGRLPGTLGLKSLWAPKKGGQNSICCRRAKKNRSQKSICVHKKGGQYSMSHWKIGVKILCSKSWEGQNSMKAKIWGSKFYFNLVEPLVKILCSLKRGVKILYFFPVPWKRGVKTAEPTNQLHIARCRASRSVKQYSGSRIAEHAKSRVTDTRGTGKSARAQGTGTGTGCNGAVSGKTIFWHGVFWDASQTSSQIKVIIDLFDNVRWPTSD